MPHDGTLLRVSADGARTEIVTTGLREPNGVAIDEEGTCLVSEQDGQWVPANALIAAGSGEHYGYAQAYATDAAREVATPVCWIPSFVDRSPAEPVCIPQDAWGPLGGAVLHLSYATGQMHVVSSDIVQGRPQGGLTALPLAPFPTGLARGRFHPRQRQLYLCGMFLWGGSQTQAGGLYRVRQTGVPLHVPMATRAFRDGLTLTFSGELDAPSVQRAGAFQVRAWNIRRTQDYGSLAYDERDFAVASARLDADGKTVRLELPDLGTAPCANVRWELKTNLGEPLVGAWQGSVFRYREESVVSP